MAVLSLLPGKLDLHLYRGDDASFRITITEDGEPAVLPAAGWKSEIRQRAKAESEKLADINIDASEAGEGVLTISISGTDTLSLPKKAAWDVQCEVDGKVRTYLAGDVLATEQVTQ